MVSKSHHIYKYLLKIRNILMKMYPPCFVLVMGRQRKRKRLECVYNAFSVNVDSNVPLYCHLVPSVPLSPLILSLEQPPVLCDLQLQPGLEVQQHVVLVLVAGDTGVELGQLCLQAGDHALEAGELCRVARLRLCQGALQGRFLLGSQEEVIG